MRKAGFICPVLYHIRNAVAAVRLLFFSGVLRGADRPADAFEGCLRKTCHSRQA
jgi:hypothetical protein